MSRFENPSSAVMRRLFFASPRQRTFAQPKSRFTDRRGGGGNKLFALFVGSILAYGAGFAYYMLAHFGLVNLIGGVNLDDSFYYFQIARNLAEGKFSTFDGGITHTNGYHPLWLALITPFYWVFDEEAALFAIKAFEIMLLAGGVALFAIAARLAQLPWILLLAMLPTLYGPTPPYQFMVFFLGLEAAASVFMLGLFFLSLVLFGRNPRRWAWLPAAVAFSLPWVRLEFAAISIAATAALCLAKWLNHRMLPFTHVKPCMGAWAGVLAYFTWNQLVFGSFVPVSGLVKSGVFSVRRWEKDGGFDLVRNFAETFQVPTIQNGIVVAAAVCGISLVTLLLALHARRRNISTPENSLLPFFMTGVFALAVAHLAKFIHSGLFMHPYWSASAWHHVPAYLMAMLLAPLACFTVIYAVKLLAPPRVSRVMSPIIIVAAAVFLVSRTDFQQPFQFVAHRSEQPYASNWLDVYAGVRVMDRLLPEGSVVGSWDAGIVGYFSRFPVLNLDGVANSVDYYRSLRTTGYEFARTPITGSGQDKFVRQHGITHFANVASEERWVAHADKRWVQHALYFSGKQFQEGFVIWSIDPPAASFDFWERMDSHFDHRTDDVGLLVDERLVQAFFRDCAPDERVALSWAGEEIGILAADASTNTHTGLCTDALVLPRDALPPVRTGEVSVDIVRAEVMSVNDGK